jgi:mRNA-degrading endonuclease RelE of RelBE toxin-antitoxin system
VDHLQGLDASQRRLVLDGADAQLRHQPEIETRNRKPMRPNPIAPWELRMGNLRLYYEVEGSQQVVRILAVGVKDRKTVRIGKEVIEL